MDAQGPEAPRPFASPTLDTFPTLVDEDNVLGTTFGFKAVPNGILISTGGVIDAIVASDFNIRRPETKKLIEGWLSAEPASLPTHDDKQDWSEEALRLFRAAGAAVRHGDPTTAIELLRRAFPLEPDNYIIRKQLWAIENPDRFYGDRIDYDWQDQQLAAGR